MHALIALLLLAAPKVDTTALELGDRAVKLVSHDAGPGPLMVNVHDDENTAVDAALAVIAKRGGRVVELQHTGARLITFQLASAKYIADPNRIFTARGVPATLHKYGATSKDAEAAVAAFAKALLGKLDPPAGWPLIALHNNTPELSYSILSYQPGGADAGEAGEVFVNPKRNANDFLLVTERKHFDALKARGFNVVLQSDKPATDDGSLSVYCGQQKRAYVNVEAQHGHLAEQTEMIDALYDAVAPK
ncbi:MAG: protein tyrosine phosphatase [Deltaproteobacteria bacterium]|nr:protein tyrosine phosphatase [Deltaproteobacteria bacterium]